MFMIMRLLVVIAFLNVLWNISSLHLKRTSSKRTCLSLTKPGTYLEKLEAARRAKQGQPVTQTPRLEQPQISNQKITVPTSNPQLVQDVVKSSISKSSNDEFPFSDEVYENLKYVITKLTTRMKSDQPLLPEEMNKFNLAVDNIIADAVQDSNQDVPESNANIPSTEQSGKIISDNPFKTFKGSSWNVPGMEKMSTEEYYKAVNDQIKSIKDARKQDPTYSRSASEDYFKLLNEKGRQSRSIQSENV